uniref:Doublecortin domain-containing protein 2B isoform X2 n=1 Tax=Geotrypetes seraphini TaxID=260995 RepID=A0A6P8RY61_GEOSA|nr:doublecortin domain-containing protein 2B isoform X2 [Geotrypetes seraphini]XP_033810460.1 doublecortin domain-containing protein 2B isoform X2 [Geotrypetes seraphini]XP_033810462.1 doublecortin domain-containing protein 2B isoform X2 [Geotrypetes seraphini]
MSSGRGDPAPRAKNVVLFRNGDPFHTGRRVVVNRRQFLTFEAFLNEVTTNIQAPTAVRNIYTPRQGHRVTQLDALQNGGCYVAAGFEKLNLSCLASGMRLPERDRRNEGIQARPAVNRKLNISAPWKKSMHGPCIIHVFRNGDLLSPPFRLLLSKSMLQQWELILSQLSERASLQTGAVRKLCTPDGLLIASGEELVSGEYYIATGAEKYKALPYVELWVSKNPSQTTFRSRARSRHETRTYKERMYNPRVHSIGAPEKTQAQTSPLTTGRKTPGKEESSIFYAKPVHVYKSRKLSRISQNGAEQELESIFKVRTSRRELEGAQEVMEDEDTYVELPLDQREAETVEDEEGAMPWSRQSYQQKYI